MSPKTDTLLTPEMEQEIQEALKLDALGSRTLTKRPTQAQRYHALSITDRFKKKTLLKYKNGAIEHGGNIWDISIPDLLTNLEEELIDAYVYLETIREKLSNENLSKGDFDG